MIHDSTSFETSNVELSASTFLSYLTKINQMYKLGLHTRSAVLAFLQPLRSRLAFRSSTRLGKCLRGEWCNRSLLVLRSWLLCCRMHRPLKVLPLALGRPFLQLLPAEQLVLGQDQRTEHLNAFPLHTTLTRTLHRRDSIPVRQPR